MTTPNDALLVRRSWLEAVDAAIFSDKTDDTGRRVHSLFYDVRPAILKSAWTQTTGGTYSATAAFIVGESPDASFIFQVYAPTATANPGGTVDAQRFFVIWRGRWELLAGAAGGSSEPSIEKAQFINAIEPTTDEFLKTATASATSEPITHIINVAAQDGALVFTAETKQILTAVEIETTKAAAVASVAKTSASAVVNIQWT